MKTIAVTILLVFGFFAGQAQTADKQAALVKISEAIALNLSEGNFDEVRETFDTNMKKALNEAQLKQVWDGLVSQLGAYKGTGSVTDKEIQGYRIIYQVLKFEKGPFKLKTAFNSSNEVAGLFLIQVNAE